MTKGFFSNFFRKSASEPLTLKTSHAATEHERRLVELCSMPVQDALGSLRSDARGLTAEAAERLLHKFGANELSHTKELSFLADIFERCKSPLVVQLLLIAAISAFIGELKSTVIVGLMVLLSVGLSYVLDRRSTNTVEALGKRVQSRTRVLREGKEHEIDLSDIVPGDIVLLNAGSIIPADLRLLAAKDFFVSQSALTGESMAVEKTAEVRVMGGQSAWELSNACFLGSSVTSGTARGVVVNTGRRTLFGSIAERLAERREETSFDKGVRSFTWLMIRFMVVMVCAVYFIVGLTKGDWVEALLFGLSIAVGLTPEMLPMIVTVNLAKGALTMAKKRSWSNGSRPSRTSAL